MIRIPNLKTYIKSIVKSPPPIIDLVPVPIQPTKRKPLGPKQIEWLRKIPSFDELRSITERVQKEGEATRSNANT
jgi:hypothetical protein